MKLDATLIKISMQFIETGSVPFWVGPAGIAKSALSHQLAADMGGKAFVIAINGMSDKGDLTPIRTETLPDGSTQQVLTPHQKIREALNWAEANPDKPCLGIFDEVNRAGSDITSAALNIITEREIAGWKFPENFKLMASGNPDGNVSALDDASISRFVVLHTEADAPTWMDFMGDSLHKAIREVLTEHPHMIWMKSKAVDVMAVDGSDDDDDDKPTAVADLLDSGEDILQITAPRTLTGLNNWLHAVSDDDLRTYLQTSATIGDREDTLLRELIEGAVGNTDFTTALIGKLSTMLTSGSSTGITSSVSAPKPDIWDSLVSARTMDEINDEISGMSGSDEISAALVYACYDKADNSRIIEALAATDHVLAGPDVKLLVTLVNDGSVDRENIDILLGTNSNVSSSLGFLSNLLD